MAKEYLEKLYNIMQKVTVKGFTGIELVGKHFFSGAAYYANGKIFVTYTPAGFAIKLPEEHRIALMKEYNARTLQYFPNAPIKKDYVVIPDDLLKDIVFLGQWIKISLDYVINE